LISILELELSRSRQKPAYNHSHSTNVRTNKMQSHVLRRLVSMNPTLISSENLSGQATIDRILLDLSAIPTDLSNGK
jgi:hypothetical protein